MKEYDNTIWRSLIGEHVIHGHGDQPAIIEVDPSGQLEVLTYGELAQEVETMVERLASEGNGQSLDLLVRAHSRRHTVITWLAALTGGHHIVLAAPGWDATQDGSWQPTHGIEDTGERVLPKSIARPQSGQRAVLSEGRFGLRTSGSTGHPKLVWHQANSLGYFRDHVGEPHWGITPTDRLYSASPLNFSFGLQSVYAALSSGASVVLAPHRKVHRDHLAIIKQSQASVFFSVPSLLAILLSHGPHTYTSPTLRLSLSAGEKLPAHLRRTWEKHSSSKVIESIGTTETLLPYLTQSLTAPDAKLRKVSCFDYGKESVDCTEAHRPLVHLEVKGPTIGSSTLHSGIDNTLLSSTGWLSTGDLFQEHSDGLEFNSRSRDRIKIRGMWTSPREFEEALRQLNSIREAVIIPFFNVHGLQRLHAFIVPDDSCATKRFQTNLEQRLLKGIRIPGATRENIRVDSVTWLDDVPRSHSGKVDRRAIQRFTSSESRGLKGPSKHRVALQQPPVPRFVSSPSTKRQHATPPIHPRPFAAR